MDWAADSSTDESLVRLARQVGEALLAAGRRVATAESCTGGWVAKCLTDVPGSSQWFECGYVTYSNRAKQRSLGVAGEVIETFGAVSRPTAEQMAAGAVHASGADLAVAVTGIAGPDGGTPAKPVGLVWLALAQREAGGAGTRGYAEEQRFGGGRDAVRRAAVARALQLLLAAATGASMPR